jgi:hypothetical protein
MKKYYWLLVAAVVLMVIGFLRAAPAFIPAALCLALWVHEWVQDGPIPRARMLAPREVRDADRGRRALEVGLCPRIRKSQPDEFAWTNRAGELLSWRCTGAGVIGRGRDRVEAFDDWEAQL